MVSGSSSIPDVLTNTAAIAWRPFSPSDGVLYYHILSCYDSSTKTEKLINAVRIGEVADVWRAVHFFLGAWQSIFRLITKF